MKTKDSIKRKKFQKKPRNRRINYGFNRRFGRNNRGVITSAHRGGGAKRLYRQVDFKRNRPGKYKIIRIEYDPNRSADIALIEDQEFRQSYILANRSMKVGQMIESGEKTALKPGNRMKLKNLPVGTSIYNVELKPNQGGKLIRSAGNFGQLKAIENNQALIALPSGEIRLTAGDCYATIGELTNPEHGFKKLKKAGQSRYLGRRPKVRGVAKHPGAHPHGGGEGRSPIGLKYPKSPTGRQSKGKKTRKKKKYSNRLIIQKRKQRR